MAKVLHGIIDDGTREIPLVNKFGKPICKVYIRPADFSIVDRYKRLMKDFNTVVEPLSELSIRNDGTAEFDKDWAVLKEVEPIFCYKNSVTEFWNVTRMLQKMLQRFSSFFSHFLVFSLIFYTM